MEKNNGCMKKNVGWKIAYIGGGSRGWARGLMADLAVEKELFGEVALYDIDFESAKNNEILGNRLYNREDVKGKWKYKAVSSLQEALTGADFVVISILPATFEEMRVDVHTPEKYGIYQSVGDTIGPGGIVRALRTIPMMKVIAEAIRDFSPNAWVINYTNPMSMTVQTLYKVFPEIKAFGCCHEVFGTQNLLAEMVREHYGVEALRDEIKVNVTGINHFTWITAAQYQDIDLLKEYKIFVEKYYEDGFYGNADKNHWINSVFGSNHRVKFDLFKKFGVIAAAGDRHLAEFCPGEWYLGSPENVKKWNFGLTSVDWRINDLKERLAKTKRLLDGEDTFELHVTGEEGVRQMKALAGLGDIVTNCNLPNVGQAADLTKGTIVETNAHFTANRIMPVCAGTLPKEVAEMVRKISERQDMVVQAGLTQNYELAFEAFKSDNLTTVSETDARVLFKEMLQGTKAWLVGVEKYLNNNG